MHVTADWVVLHGGSSEGAEDAAAEDAHDVLAGVHVASGGGA